MFAALIAGILAVGTAAVPVLAAEDVGTASQIEEEVLEDEDSAPDSPIEEEKMETEDSETASVDVDTDDEDSRSSANDEDLRSSTEDEDTEEAEDEISYTITLDANGGYFENKRDDVLCEFVEKTEILNKVILPDESVKDFPEYTREDQTASFLGWSLERDGELVSQGYDEYVPTESCVLFAVWDITQLSGEETEEAADSLQESGKHASGVLFESEGMEGTEKEASGLALKASGSEVVDSGTCGIGSNSENVRWSLTRNGSNLTLTISGQGEIAPFKSPDYIPWRQGTYRTAISTLIIEDGVTGIAYMNFADCTNLKSVSIPNSMTKIGSDAFANCSSLPGITIPDSVRSIGNGSFSHCSSLTSVSLPQGITSIEDSVFSKCSSLTGITLPNSVTSIKDNAFSGCSSLKNITIPNGVTSIGSFAFEECTSLTSLKIPDGVTSIEEGLCADCSGLLSVTIPNSVKKIAEYSFPRCTGLTSITIPGSVESIGDYAFGECSSLTNIYFCGHAPEFVKTEHDDGYFDGDDYVEPEESWEACYCFEGVTAFAHYPLDDNTWTDDVKQDYGGHITWVEGDTISISQVSMSISASSFVYTGSAKTPNVTVKVGNITLVNGTDYTVSYNNNTNAGTATVTVTGKGNYTGTKSATFIISKADQNITAKSSASSIAVGKTATVSITGAKGTKSFKSSDASVAAVNTSTGVVTGKKAGTVTITATSAATSNYNAASKAVKITVTASKSLKKPGNCHFAKWNNAKYTSCRIAWNKVADAEGYQTLLSWTDGSHASSTIVKSNVLYRDCTVHPQHVSQMKVRAFYMQNGQRVFGAWSNVEYITPSPTKLTTKNAGSGSNRKMNISWNIIYGCNGYNVFITTNPNGKWYWNQSTSEKATATSASIDKCGGAKLKKNTRYYVRIVTRRKRNGVFCTVPMPANNTYVGSFIIK